MLWLAGLIGLMAIGAIAFVDFSSDVEADDGEDFSDFADDMEFSDPTTDLTESAEPNSDSFELNSETHAEESEDVPASAEVAQSDGDGDEAVPSATILAAHDIRDETKREDNLAEGEDADPFGVETILDELLGDIDEDADLASDLEAAATLVAMASKETDADGDATDIWDHWFDEDPDLDAFDPATEELMVVWDDSSGDAPELSLVTKEDTGITQIRLGDSVIGDVDSDVELSADMIGLIPLSTAQGLGWAPV